MECSIKLIVEGEVVICIDNKDEEVHYSPNGSRFDSSNSYIFPEVIGCGLSSMSEGGKESLHEYKKKIDNAFKLSFYQLMEYIEQEEKRAPMYVAADLALKLKNSTLLDGVLEIIRKDLGDENILDNVVDCTGIVEVNIVEEKEQSMFVKHTIVPHGVIKLLS